MNNYVFNFPVTCFSSLLDWYHNYTNSLLLGVLFMVSVFVAFEILYLGHFKYDSSVYQSVELSSIVFPTLVVCLIIVYSVYLLYAFVFYESYGVLTVKATGHQWYWSYEFGGSEVSFDSFMIPQEDLSLCSSFRGLEASPSLVFPSLIPVRMVFTSADVIHAWSVPVLGVKLDCIPGVLSVLSLSVPLGGVYYGQCAELCGSAHSFMPITLEVCSKNSFFWSSLLF